MLDLKLMGKAAYFYNIGHMCVPMDCYINRNQSLANTEIYQQHTVMGAKIIRLNEAGNCKHFTKICAEICMHHHERYDGKGFPHGLDGDDNQIYSQVCGFAVQFDRLFNPRPEYNDMQFDFVLNEMKRDRGAFSPELYDLAEKCRYEIFNYYRGLEV